MGIAHQTKSSAGNIGATRIEDLAEALEVTLRRQASRAEIDSTLAALHGPLALLVQQLKVQLAAPAAGLTRQLLAFSRKQVLSPQAFDLNVMLTDMRHMLRVLISEDIALRLSCAPAPAFVNADRGQLEQVVMNLAVNARDAMPNGGKLSIHIALSHNATAHQLPTGVLEPGPYIVLTVTDSGSGMTDTVKAHLFEPFFTTKAVGKGTGLGLATCYGIVRQSAGHIQLDSAPGQGTTFRIYLPAVAASAAPRPVTLEAPAGPQATEWILVAEDEPGLRELATSLLREAGYSVLEAANGMDALQLAAQHSDHPIHLLLTDVVMPKMGGRELAERLHAQRPDTKLLFTSGYSDDVLTQHGVLAPSIAFLAKPYTPAALSRKVRQVLDCPVPT